MTNKSLQQRLEEARADSPINDMNNLQQAITVNASLAKGNITHSAETKEHLKQIRNNNVYKEDMKKRKSNNNSICRIYYPNGLHKDFISANEALRSLGHETTKTKGGQGYRFFKKDGSLFIGQRGKLRGYKFQRIYNQP